MAFVGIPEPPHNMDKKLRAILNALRENVLIMEGKLGTTDERFMTVADARKIGVIGVQNTVLFNPNAPEQQSFTEDSPGGTTLIYDDYSVLVTGTGTSRVITIQAKYPGYYLFRLTLTDLATAPATKTLAPPNGSDSSEWMLPTDSTGKLVKTVTHDGAAQTWYMGIVMLGKIKVSNALAFT